jgi:hypothetical protein
MQEINWKAFELKHSKATEAFESLCYFLFCRKYNLAEGARTDFNQVGLETEPIKNSDDMNTAMIVLYLLRVLQVRLKLMIMILTDICY